MEFLKDSLVPLANAGASGIGVLAIICVSVIIAKNKQLDDKTVDLLKFFIRACVVITVITGVVSMATYHLDKSELEDLRKNNKELIAESKKFSPAKVEELNKTVAALTTDKNEQLTKIEDYRRRFLGIREGLGSLETSVVNRGLPSFRQNVLQYKLSTGDLGQLDDLIKSAQKATKQIRENVNGAS